MVIKQNHRQHSQPPSPFRFRLSCGGRSPDRATRWTAGFPSRASVTSQLPGGKRLREAVESLSPHQLTSLQSAKLPLQKIKKGKRPVPPSHFPSISLFPVPCPLSPNFRP